MHISTAAATAKRLTDKWSDENKFLYLTLFLETQRDAAILKREWLARCLSNNKRVAAFGDALASASFELEEKRNSFLRSLIREGHLLFAFPGTTVLQGGAA